MKSVMQRGRKSTLNLKQRIVCHAENGLRSVPIEKTIQHIEQFFLKSPVEAQFTFVKKGSGRINRAILKYHSPEGKSEDKHYFGKGLTIGQNIASAGFEFFERYCARMSPDDPIREASFHEVSGQAVDPRLFHLGNSSFDSSLKIDWIWGYSLTREIPVLLPANLVFLPYLPDIMEKHIVLSDSNGIAAGNNPEEAILHALLEVIERDQLNISEYNRLPVRRIAPESIPDVCRPLLKDLKSKGFLVHLFAGSSDLPIPFMIAFLQHGKTASRCSVAYGSYPDPVIALERALTEAVQMLPPSGSHKAWLESGAPEFFRSGSQAEIPFSSVKNLATNDIRETIRKCISILEDIGSEVFVVDLSHPDIPFPAVRVLATRLQPRLNGDSLRFSDRFFEVPVKLGFWDHKKTVSEIKLWSICGYR
jgi:ribosomal protein S12 methylthiotransferase accessory factor YcaO